MSGTLNVKRYDAGLQKLASFFHSGNQFLDQFLTSPHALNPNYGTTYVFLDDDDKIIIGYYNLGMGYIEECDGTSSVKLGGAVHINEFALDAEYQDLLQQTLPDGSHMYLADFLMIDCMERIMDIRENYIGCSFITLCATEDGYHLYRRHGFEPMDEEMRFSTEDDGIPYASMYYAIETE